MAIIGKELPEFSVQGFRNPDVVTVTKADVIGKWSVFVFYPADFTFVCPTELEDLQSHYEELKDMGVEVFSVSVDSEFVHKAWADTSPNIAKIQYTMLADQKHELADFFETFSEEEGRAYRGSFVVDPEGRVQTAEIHNMGIGRSADELVRKVQAAQFVAKHGDQVCPAKWKPGKDTLKPGLDLVGKL
ncbi:alkyl hydroperoxide reductase subunit C [uncultured Veillonella sp.]|jgi:peroxiredoxin|uniref:alkyl hydroperoxide reductase subunit C n=1 Tax=uncultured Veillonella sp. TaxID=159268 RepID=UPI00258D5BCB|nr:alkyl hydroperoxide reductase subunit C [uncultured Veillonella sp.]